MFHFVWLIKKDEHRKVLILVNDILQKNLHYDKMIFYFEDPTNKEEFMCDILYHINKTKMEIFDLHFYEASNVKLKNALIKTGFVMNEIAHIHGKICLYIFPHLLNIDDHVDLILSSMVHTIQQTLKDGISCGKNNSMIAFQYDHVWIKKLFYELKYRSFIESDFMALLHHLIQKYKATYTGTS